MDEIRQSAQRRRGVLLSREPSGPGRAAVRLLPVVHCDSAIAGEMAIAIGHDRLLGIMYPRRVCDEGLRALQSLGGRCCHQPPPDAMSQDATVRHLLLRRGLRLEYTTLGWNIVGCVVL